MTLLRSEVVAQVVAEIENDDESFEFWKLLPVDDLILHHNTIGMAIRNEFKMWVPGNMPDGVHPDDFSMNVMTDVHAAIAALPNDRSMLVEDLDDSEFEFVCDPDDAVVDRSSPMSAETIDAMKSFDWIHTSGTTYEIIAIANNDADLGRRSEYPITVVYRNVETNQEWSKPIERFLATMTRGGVRATS